MAIGMKADDGSRTATFGLRRPPAPTPTCTDSRGAATGVLDPGCCHREGEQANGDPERAGDHRATILKRRVCGCELPPVLVATKMTR